MIHFNFKSFILAIMLLIIEFAIANTSGFLRHTFGDYLVVILLFFLIKSFIKVKTKKLILYVVLFSYLVEILQGIELTKLLGIAKDSTAGIVIGNTFSYVDLIAYSLGGLTIYFGDIIYKKQLKLI